MRKPSIPPVPKKGDDRARFDGAVKESLEIVMARRKGATPIVALDPATATAADCARTLNEIIERLQ